MRHCWTIIIITILVLITSFYLLAILPVNRLSTLKPVSDGAGGYYPVERPAQALKGQQIYRSLGCYYCHTKVVKPYDYGTDYERGWGIRRLVARDFIADQLIMPGLTRLGPDLANIGVRKPEKFAISWKYSSTNQSTQIKEMEKRLYMILYDSKQLNGKSIMPSYKYLFKTMPSNSSYSMSDFAQHASAEPIGINNQTVIPSSPAVYLAEYLKSLKYEYPLFEAPPPLNPERLIRRTSEITNVLQSTTPQ